MSCEFNRTTDGVCEPRTERKEGFRKRVWEEEADVPGGGIPLVVGRTRRVDALVASSRVEAHAVRPTAHALLQTLVNI